MKCRNCKAYDEDIGLGVCKFCDQKERDFELARKPRRDVLDAVIVMVVAAAILAAYIVTRP